MSDVDVAWNFRQVSSHFHLIPNVFSFSFVWYHPANRSKAITLYIILSADRFSLQP